MDSRPGPIAWVGDSDDEIDIDNRSAKNGDGVDITNRNWFRRSYIGDYIITCALFGSVGLLYYFVPVFNRLMIDPDDYSAPYFGAGIVPPWALSIVCIVGPLLVFGLAQWFKRSPHDFHNTVLGLFEGLAFTLLSTEALKLSSGEYRPDYLTIIEDNMPPSVVKDARQSFPSGHSSLSFCAMVYLTMWLSANLRVVAKHGNGAMWRAVIALSPLVVSAFVAVSRVDDYHHHFIDIVAGAVMGSAFGAYSWLLNYPSIFSAAPEVPRLRRE